MGLPVNDQRVDDAPDVVHRGITLDLHETGVGVDLQLAGRATVREHGNVHLVLARDRQSV